METKKISKWAKRVLVVLIIMAAAYSTLLALDIVVGWSVYGYFLRKLVSYGVPDYLGGILAIWLAAAILWFGPTIVVSIIKRRKDWIWKVALGISVWLGIMYVASYPYSDGLFNPFTGKARYRYSKTTDGEIKKFPLAFTVDPKTGMSLRNFDSKMAEEYFKQQREREQQKSKKFFSSSLTDDQTRIVDLIKKGKMDLDSYFGAKENVFELKSERIKGGEKTGLFGWGDWVHKYNLFVEKIIFVSSTYTIIGICFEGTADEFDLDIKNVYILDSRGVKYQPVNYIGAKKDGDSYKIKLNKGEIKRVFIVLEYIFPEKLRTGAYTREDVCLRFSVKEARDSERDIASNSPPESPKPLIQPEATKQAPNIVRQTHDTEPKVALSYKPPVFVRDSLFRIEINSVKRIDESRLRFGMSIKLLDPTTKYSVREGGLMRVDGIDQPEKAAYIVDPSGNKYFFVDQENMLGKDYLIPAGVNIEGSMTFLAPPPTVKQISLIFFQFWVNGYRTDVVFRNLDLNTLKLIE